MQISKLGQGIEFSWSIHKELLLVVEVVLKIDLQIHKKNQKSNYIEKRKLYRPVLYPLSLPSAHHTSCEL